ncbi:hypothetical protein LOZ53_005319 [Ophidiomyces ophidiicola]|uniref:uncharacterized protein n=1 Tax=Ophidiomyces ophidiicola TaxID=1387563 RepID=UPI0020C5493A|nr:uncharacterized protein LOZ57_004488 [Ophidiomyces ophidiicola]KAI1907352.1 hypothetical protein LOZ64_005914 [Ophidiomyces ophidiicola]KAI1909752.1 hypothetical protein LOZ61_004814 [Ophidiomyces ophidiicola]KAI1924649.1 hypothetical protein LOZ60_004569 [Ophidiomyces ophidiicola]KAI1945189.1 hypothetical protein LOZ57_004488 [Ophidiomyces ophidiicola]KAI1955056.1 hypothetical protein LOZ59_004732 [Ophidiomyces ophidiicola]
MNYHRYGEKYGFHVDQLECNFGIPDDTLHPDQWMCFKLSATIVDDELLVMLDYSSLFYLDQPDSLKAAEEKIRGPHHSLCASHGFQHLRNWTEEYFVKAYRCRKCSNEVRDTVDFNYGPGQGETRRTMWCNLGRCADSNDRKWCMATLAKSSRCRYGASSLRKSIYADFFDDRSPRKTALKLPGKIHEHFRSRRRFPPFPCSSF